MPRKQTRKRTQKRKRYNGGAFPTVLTPAGQDLRDYIPNFDVFYYLKLGKLQEFNYETGESVFEQNGQFYSVDPKSSLIFEYNK